MTANNERTERGLIPNLKAPVHHSSATDGPGALRGEAWLIFQTRDAYRLALGRAAQPGKPRIFGLQVFGSMVSVIYLRARLDDPYADWWLLKIEDCLISARHEIDNLRKKITEELQPQDGIQIRVAASTQPVRIPLQFNNPYANRAARVIADYDKLMLAALTARQHGLVDRERFGQIRDQGGHAVRRLLNSGAGFKNQGASRDDFAANNPRAEKARELMGELPEDVLTGTRRGAMAPNVINEPDPA